MNRPILITRIVRGKQQIYYRKPWGHTKWAERHCVECGTPFYPNSGITKFCIPCRKKVTKILVSQSGRRYRDRKFGPLQNLVCPTCERVFMQKRRKQTHCNRQDQCRPWLQAPIERGGQGMRYLIGTLRPAEYAFYRIMQDRGVQLEFLPQSSNGLFSLYRGCYTPDFFDPIHQVYYEVSGSRQAFKRNEHKYKEMRVKYPEIMLKIVTPEGIEITKSA